MEVLCVCVCVCVGVWGRERKEEEEEEGGAKFAPVNTSMVASISIPSPSLLRLVIVANSASGMRSLYVDGGQE